MTGSLWQLRLLDSQVPQQRTNTAIPPSQDGTGAAPAALIVVGSGSRSFLKSATEVVPSPIPGVSPRMYHLLFVLILPPLLAFTFWLAIRTFGSGFSPTQDSLLTLLVLASWPVVWGLHARQPALVVSVLVLLACIQLRRSQGTTAGILLAFSTLEPQLMLPMLVWLLLWASQERMWSFFVSFAVTTAALFTFTDVFFPTWLARWREWVGEYVGMTRHLLFADPSIAERWLALGVVVGLLAVSSWLLWRWRQAAPWSDEFASAIAVVLALTVCLLPESSRMHAGRVLLVPAVGILWNLGGLRGLWANLVLKGAVLVLGLELLAPSIAVAGESIFGPSPAWQMLPFQSMLVPAVVTLALICALWSESASTADVAVPGSPRAIAAA